jgi:hypothetical protein
MQEAQPIKWLRIIHWKSAESRVRRGILGFASTAGIAGCPGSKLVLSPSVFPAGAFCLRAVEVVVCSSALLLFRSSTSGNRSRRLVPKRPTYFIGQQSPSEFWQMIFGAQHLNALEVHHADEFYCCFCGSSDRAYDKCTDEI